MKIPEMLRRKIDEIDITNGRDIKDVSKLRDGRESGNGRESRNGTDTRNDKEKKMAETQDTKEIFKGKKEKQKHEKDQTKVEANRW